MTQAFTITARHGEDSEASYFDRQTRIGWWDQNRIAAARVLVIGAGALGNEVIKNLVLLGFGRIDICDLDHISTSNLSRTVLFGAEDIGSRKAETAAQRAAAMALSARTEMRWFGGDIVWQLGLGVYRDADIVLSCLDNIEARIAINRACRLVGTPWVDAAIGELSWQVVPYASHGACYECGLSPADRSRARRYYSCDNVKRAAAFEEKVPTVQVASAAAAAIQVQEALKILHRQPVAFATRLLWQGYTNECCAVPIAPRNICLAHARFEAVCITKASAQMDLATFLALAEEIVGPGAALDLSGERAFMRAAHCRCCGRKIEIDCPAWAVTEADLICCSSVPPGAVAALPPEVPTRTDLVSRFSAAETPDLLSRSLESLGIPAHHIVEVIGADGRIAAIELGADAGRMFTPVPARA